MGRNARRKSSRLDPKEKTPVFAPKVLALFVGVAFLMPGAEARSEEAGQPWWHSYSTVATDPEKKSLGEIRTINADCWRAAGWYAGWYGLWFGDFLEHHTNVPQRWGKVEEAGARPMMYLDSGEVGDFVVLVDEEKRELLLDGWSWHQWKGQAGHVHWFGLEAFMNNVPWAPHNTARHYDLPTFTCPDGSAIEDGKLYEVLARRDHGNDWQLSYFTNPDVTDEVARDSGLADHSLRQQLAPDVQQGSGWVIGRLAFLDHANPQFGVFQRREIAQAIARFRPQGVHIDDFGATDIWGISSSFGMWSVHMYRAFLASRFTPEQINEMGVEDPGTFDIRAYVASAHQAEGITENERLRSDVWFNDILFRCHLLNKTERGIANARGVYAAGKAAMAAEGLDGPVFGNVLPLLPSAGFMEGACDIAHFEWKSVGAYPMMPELGLPPRARSAYVTRLGEKISAASYCWPSIYVPREYSGEAYETLHKVMAFDALANRGIMDYNHWYLDNYSPGSDRSAGHINTFIKAVAPVISGRAYCADIALVYCPWSNVASIDAMGLHPEVMVNEYKGWCDYLCNSHSQWDVLLSGHLDASELGKYKVAVLPSMASVTEEQAEELARYLDAGGTVIATGESGRFAGPEGYLMPHDTNPLDRLAGRDRFIRTDRKPGKTYLDTQWQASAREELDKLLAAADFAASLATDAPEEIGVNMSRVTRDGNVSITIDLNNHAYNLELDEVTPTCTVKITVQLPQELRHRELHLTAASPDNVGETVWRVFPADQWQAGMDTATLHVTVPPFEHFMILRVEESGAQAHDALAG
jgi:hypothetical protein